MSLELYQTRWQFNFRGRVCTQQFYFLANNSGDMHPYELARQIQENIFIVSSWGFYLLELQSQRGFLRRLSTQRRLPTYGPAWSRRFQADLFPGMALGNLTDNFQTMNIHWHYAGDFTGKAMNRIGPLGEFALNNGEFSSFYQIAAEAFINEHRAERVTTGGVIFQGATLNRLNLVFPIQSGHLDPTPGRQRNRRWVA